jgi:hypothetical protein
VAVIDFTMHHPFGDRAGGELIDIENRCDAVGVVDTSPMTASASRERLELANEAGSLDLALDAADTIQGQEQFGENVGLRRHQLSSI